ncbi:class I SAM-dependent methyltransferase [Hymenobacter rubripertinctus]|uniref:Class I SAM-dependent methyltransferase n=1 Tax=Hymenobacter rubripertinctus TaxID=2029981 RepID=A0A418QZ87_9BACT|nr:class I SAM-dependent methyltransferase [Hymenobacter rubripertinctus]RIY10496.1 class I SAM-dependent methyltransferase [Hymenobacter rubripertinctus]
MATPNSKQHWETVYGTRQPHQVSWTETVPATSLEFIHDFRLPRQAPIIDVGGGDSRLVDHLLAEGYENLTVLDISGAALARARQRLGPLAARVHWVEADVRDFEPAQPYALWHDRAAFHFLTTAPDVARYLTLARAAVAPGGYLTMGTFSPTGPTSCSGLPIRQYSEQELSTQLQTGFTKLRCRTEDHCTPFQTTQNFLFCSFRRQLRDVA